MVERLESQCSLAWEWSAPGRAALIVRCGGECPLTSVSKGAAPCSAVMRGGLLFFFFQAEDGIRDLTVTGVQTCALPICCPIRVFVYPLHPNACAEGVPAFGEAQVIGQAVVFIDTEKGVVARHRRDGRRDRKSVV